MYQVSHLGRGEESGPAVYWNGEVGTLCLASNLSKLESEFISKGLRNYMVNLLSHIQSVSFSLPLQTVHENYIITYGGIMPVADDRFRVVLPMSIYDVQSWVKLIWGVDE